MLFQYLQRTRLLLQDQDFSTFNEEDLTSFVNMGRGQLAAETECIRVYPTLAVDETTQQYYFADIDLTSFDGVEGVLNVRQISYALGSGQQIIHTRPWQWFNLYVLSNAAPVAGPPSVWSQFGQGSTGSFWVNLLDAGYTLSLDIAAYPSALTTDESDEALPYQFTDAVPFFAAYMSLLTVGEKDRAKEMFDEYTKFASRGRAAATPGVLPLSFAQAPDPFMQNRLGLVQKGGQQ